MWNWTHFQQVLNKQVDHQLRVCTSRSAEDQPSTLHVDLKPKDLNLRRFQRHSLPIGTIPPAMPIGLCHSRPSPAVPPLDRPQFNKTVQFLAQQPSIYRPLYGSPSEHDVHFIGHALNDVNDRYGPIPNVSLDHRQPLSTPRLARAIEYAKHLSNERHLNLCRGQVNAVSMEDDDLTEPPSLSVSSADWDTGIQATYHLGGWVEVHRDPLNWKDNVVMPVETDLQRSTSSPEVGAAVAPTVPSTVASFGSSNDSRGYFSDGSISSEDSSYSSYLSDESYLSDSSADWRYAVRNELQKCEDFYHGIDRDLKACRSFLPMSHR